LSENGTSKSLEVLKQISSTGYLRKRLPQELVVLQGGQTNLALDNNSVSAEPTVATLEQEPDLAASAVDPRTKAKMQGYEGDPCGDCGNYTLVRNGTCMKCNTCGATSGCS
jgi:ribonucleoside-diphosphate reductase alpha chain